MRFLNLTDIAPQSFIKCLEKTSNIELLSTIQKLMLDTQEHFKNGIPTYGKKLSSDQECIEAKKELLSALLHEYQLRMCSLYNNGRMHLAEAKVKKVKGSKDSEKIINDVATLSTGTLCKLLKDQGINETRYQILDKIHQKFIQFTVGALDSAPSAYKTWMDAWKYFTDTYDLPTLNLKSEASLDLKRQLQSLGIKVEGNYVRKKDLKILSANSGKKIHYKGKEYDLDEQAKKWLYHESHFWKGMTDKDFEDSVKILGRKRSPEDLEFLLAVWTRTREMMND